MTALAVQLFYVDKQQARYAELSTSLMLGLSSLQAQLNSDVKAGNPLEEQKHKFDEHCDATKQAFNNAGENLNHLIRSRKELMPAFNHLRTALASNMS
jgi:hypothetical protein